MYISVGDDPVNNPCLVLGITQPEFDDLKKNGFTNVPGQLLGIDVRVFLFGAEDHPGLAASISAVFGEIEPSAGCPECAVEQGMNYRPMPGGMPGCKHIPSSN